MILYICDLLPAVTRVGGLGVLQLTLAFRRFGEKQLDPFAEFGSVAPALSEGVRFLTVGTFSGDTLMLPDADRHRYQKDLE